MADSRDKPELETLDYKAKISSPHHNISCKCSACETLQRAPRQVAKPPKPLKRGFLGLNAHVIKPEMRTNKTEIAEQPNQNLMIISEIEGLLSQANDKMYDLPIHPVRSKAIEEIDLLNKVTVKIDLRKAFE